MNALTAEKDNWRTAFEQERTAGQQLALVLPLIRLGHRTTNGPS
ncbi:hypothetical protein [Streptomyces coeruleorubidus]